MLFCYSILHVSNNFIWMDILRVDFCYKWNSILLWATLKCCIRNSSLCFVEHKIWICCNKASSYLQYWDHSTTNYHYPRVKGVRLHQPISPLLLHYAMYSFQHYISGSLQFPFLAILHLHCFSGQLIGSYILGVTTVLHTCTPCDLSTHW